MPRINDLKASLQRLFEGDYTNADRELVKKAFFNGQIQYVPDAAPVNSAGGSSKTIAAGTVSDAVFIQGNNASVNFGMGEGLFELIRGLIFPKPPGITPPFPISIFIGREKALKDMKRLLGAGRAARKSKVLIVRGWPGVGKTTLISVIGRDPDIARAFPDGVLWASLTLKLNGDSPDLLSEMAAWGRALGTDELLRAPTLDEVTRRLGYLLQNKKMLLILDDVWQLQHALPFLKAAGHDCATLITTRETTQVAIDLAPTPEAIYVLPVLAEEDGFKLLKAISPAAVKKHPQECRELVRALEYLPLALHVAGRLINTELQVGSSARLLRKLLEDIQDGAAIIEATAPPDRYEGGGRPTVQALLKKSTDLLDEYTRDCFAFLGPFKPRPATFNLEALKFQWQVEDPLPIVRKLVGHGLMELVGSGRYQMHALLVAHAQSLLE